MTARRLPAVHPARWRWFAPPPGAWHLAGWAILPLRLFLGATFLFAGLQKLANPAFFDSANPASIQAQMLGAARHSPIHALITPLAHHAGLVGVVIALSEIAVGVGALLGLFTRIAALGGALISLSLFLAVSFHTNPYYTGSDIVFFFAWLPLLLCGGGQLAVDTLISNMTAGRRSKPSSVAVQFPFSTVQGICGRYDNGWCTDRRKNAPCQPGGCPFLMEETARAAALSDDAIDGDRRRLAGAVAAGVGVFALLGAGVVAGLGRLLHTASAAAPSELASSRTPTPAAAPTTSTAASTAPAAPTPTASSAKPTPSPTASAANTPSPTPSHSTTAAKPPGTKLGPASAVPVGGAASFRDPATGDPAIVVQPSAGKFLAFDAVCPHAGCTVGYDSRNAIFYCPCHGSRFNGTSGAVEIGPARSGLGKIAIAEGSDGQLYAK